MRRLAIPFLSVCLSVALSACAQPCQKTATCAVIGTGSDIQVCDGSEYKGCGDGNRGQTIGCVNQPEVAVCTPTGWAFEPTGGQ